MSDLIVTASVWYLPLFICTPIATRLPLEIIPAQHCNWNLKVHAYVSILSFRELNSQAAVFFLKLWP